MAIVYFNYRILDCIDEIVFVFVQSFSDFEEGKSMQFRQCISQFAEMFNDVSFLKNSIALYVTKCDPDYEFKEAQQEVKNALTELLTLSSIS